MLTQTRSKVIVALFVGGVFFIGAKIHQGGSQAAADATNAVADIAHTKVAAAATCPEKLGGKKKVGIQAGHLAISELPDEQDSLRYDYGASSAGIDEVDIDQDIAQRTVTLLKKQGIDAEVLPATVPQDYCASAFVAIHADGNDDTTVFGYKVAPSFWDTDGKAQSLSDNLQEDYGTATSMSLNPTITDNMTQYYAFNFGHFSHAIDAATPGALIEVGFLSNPTDRYRMVNSPALLAKGIANGIQDFLNGKTVSVASSSSAN